MIESKKKSDKVDVVGMLLRDEEVSVGQKLTLVRYGGRVTLQLFSKHPLDNGSSVLIEGDDLEALRGILNEYSQRVKV